MPSNLILSLLASCASGGADRDRTDDLKLAKLALSQLSYGPDPENRIPNTGIRADGRPSDPCLPYSVIGPPKAGDGGPGWS